MERVQRNSIGFIALLLVALVGSIAIVAGAERDCSPSKSRPVYKETIVTSEDNTAIVSLQANLLWYSLANKTKTYTTIDAQKVYLEKESDYEYLSIISSCNTMKMSLKKHHNTVKLEKIEISQIDSDGESKFLCTVPMVEQTAFPLENSCEFKLSQIYVPRKWSCYKNLDRRSPTKLTADNNGGDESMIWFVAHKFKFEIDGNPEMIKQKQFSKLAIEC